MTEHTRIGIVLSSGGARGMFAHTGFLQALHELNIAFTLVAGCSAGAIVGGIAASGTKLADWSDTLSKARARDFWNPDPIWRILWQLVARRGRGYTGLASAESAMALLKTQLAVETFEECPVRFRALALSLNDNQKVVFSSGELAPRIVASAAAPVLYRPIEIEGNFYCDGAVVEFGPFDAVCCDQDVDLIILHHVSIHRVGAERLRASLQAPWALCRIVDWIVYRQHPWYVTGAPISFHRCPGGCGTTIAVLEPILPDLPWATVRDGPQVQRAAHRQAVDALTGKLQPLLSAPDTLRSNSSSLVNDGS